MGIFDFVTGYGGPLEGQSGGMMGGLGGLFDPQDPRKVGLLSAAFGLLGQQGFGNAGLLGMQASQQARSRALQEKRQSLQDELVKNQLDQQKRQKHLDDLAPQYLKTIRPDTMDDRDVGLPGESPVTPQMDLQGLAQAYLGAPGGLERGLQLQQALKKQTPQPVKLGAGETLLDPTTYKPLAANPKANEPPSGVQEYQFAVSQGYKGTFEQWDTARKKAGAASVSVNTGQKGYENESKLRNDFKSEPIYKDFQDMQSAYKQIKAGIAQGTPIGDVATATKIMKLLDPGSVVRESELGIAMAAGGRMDRLQNYVQMQISGEKLTPQMRKEFGLLSDELYKAAAQTYNSKRAEYEQMGKRYQLDPTVLGAPADAPKSSGPRVGEVQQGYKFKGGNPADPKNWEKQ